jgi:hypothetical protein
MAAPDPRTWAVGDKATASRMNLELRDALDFLLAPPSCSLVASSVSSTTAIDTVIAFDSETYDTDTMHTGSGSKITFTTAGVYLVTGVAVWVSNSTGYRQVQMRLNANGSVGSGTLIRSWYAAAANGNATSITFAWQRSFAANDHIEFWGTQTSGGGLGLTGYAQAVWQST